MKGGDTGTGNPDGLPQHGAEWLAWPDRGEVGTPILIKRCYKALALDPGMLPSKPPPSGLLDTSTL